MTGEEADPGYSKQQPGWHVFVLSVLTMSAYNFYWFYRNLISISEEGSAVGASSSGDSADKITAPQPRFCQQHPYFSTLLFFIPVVNMIIAMEFFAAVGDKLPNKESFWHKNNLLCAFALALFFGAAFLFYMAPDSWWLLYMLNVVPLVVAQVGLNKHWKELEGGKILVRAAFNPLELVVIFFGAGLLGLVAIAPFVLPHAK